MKSSFADPDPVPFLPLHPGSGIGKNQDPDPGSGSGMNNPDHISESLETIFSLKYLMQNRDGKNSDPGPGWKKFGSGIRNTGEIPPVDLLICGLLLGPGSGRFLLHLGVMGLHVLLQHFSSLRAKQRWNS